MLHAKRAKLRAAKAVVEKRGKNARSRLPLSVSASGAARSPRASFGCTSLRDEKQCSEFQNQPGRWSKRGLGASVSRLLNEGFAAFEDCADKIILYLEMANLGPLPLT
jgi:hypothetical protein